MADDGEAPAAKRLRCERLGSRLLAGARGEPQRRVLDLVSAARDRRYKLWHERGWSSDLYPELGDAREAPVYKQMMHR